MDIETAWMNATRQQRYWYLYNAGWDVRDLNTNKQARTVARRTWDNLNPDLQTLLTEKARLAGGVQFHFQEG